MQDMLRFQACDGAYTFCYGAYTFHDGAYTFCDGAYFFCESVQVFAMIYNYVQLYNYCCVVVLMPPQGTMRCSAHVASACMIKVKV